MNKRKYQFMAVAAAAVLIGLLSPRAAHAVAAALVQVTNTASNPVMSQATPSLASQQVVLYPPLFGTTVSDQLIALNQYVPVQGLSTSAYVVPAGQNLVITSLDTALFGTTNTTLRLRQVNNSGDSSIFEAISSVPGTHQYFFPNGLVYPAGSSVFVENVTGSGNADVVVHGYLTAN